MQRRRFLAASAALLFALAAAPAFAQADAPPCSAEVRGALDFWAGDWNVDGTASHERAGTDRVERADKGFAFIERWTGVDGGEGVSLFSLDPKACTWRQLWITDHPALPGGLKAKDLVALMPGGGVRFQGSYPGRRFPFVLDRTTLTPRADGTVRQVIEVSGDGGQSWTAGFDAVYTRR
jgi:hypothetical protein